MGALQKVAKGFTGLLGLREAGATPQQWAEFLQPTMDLLAFYAAERGTKARATTSALAGIGSTIELEIPAGEIWLVRHLGANISFGAAGQQYAVTLRHDGIPFLNGGTATVELTTKATHISGGASGASSVDYTWPVPVIALGGEKFTLRLDDDITGGGFVGLVSSFNAIFTLISSGPGQVGLQR